MIYKSLSPSVR